MSKADKVATREGSTTWRLEIPFQYAWVEARVRKTNLASIDAESFIEEEFDSLCGVRFQEIESDDARRLRLSDAWQMHASCPFCVEGSDQLLQSGKWVYVHEWRHDEVDALSEETGTSESLDKHRIREMNDWGVDNPLNVDFIRDAFEQWVARDEKRPNGKIAAWSTDNAYGVNILELRGMNMGQMGLPLQGVDFTSRMLGVEGYFGGLYRCAHCGGRFAAVYRNRVEPRKQGRYELHEAVDRAITHFIDMTNAMRDRSVDCLNEQGLIPTMSVDITDAEGLVSLRTNIGGRWHRLDFDTTRGTILLDGSSYVHGEFKLHDLFGHPMVRTGLFNERRLVEALSLKLSALPDDVAFFKEKFLGERNLLLLIAANRFRGYPADFYNTIAGMERFYKVYPLGTGLPRECADLPALYRMTGLPEKKSLKRALFNRPLVLHMLLEEPDLPFKNVDILRRFFEHRNASSLIECMNVTEHSCAGWRQVASAKGEDYLLRMLLDKPSTHISAISRLFEYAHDGSVSMDMNSIFDFSTRDFSRCRACFEWQHEHPDMDIDEPYQYDFVQSDLEWKTGEYAFVLPKNPRELIVAAADLSNCLDGYVARIGNGKGMTIVLIHEGDMAVGAIEVSSSKSVTQALTVFNKPVESMDSLNSAFMKWMNVKNLKRAPGADDF